MKLSIWVQVCGFYCVSLIHMLPRYWCPVIQTMRTPDMTHHHSIYYYCNISNTAALNELVGLFQGARLEYSCFMKVETFFFPSSPLPSSPFLSSPLLSSPLLSSPLLSSCYFCPRACPRAWPLVPGLRVRDTAPHSLFCWKIASLTLPGRPAAPAWVFL